MVDYSVTNYNPYNMYYNYGYYYPSYNGAYTQQYQNVPLYDFNTLNYNYNNQPNTVTFSANSQIQAETKKQGMSTGAKVAFGAGIATALAIGADFVFCKGKHVKSIFGKAGNKGGGSTGKPNANPTNTTHSTTTMPKNTHATETSTTQVPIKTSATPTLQQTNSTPNGSSNNTALANSVNASSNVPNDKMRVYIAKKYNTGIDYNSRPCGNYADAIYRNYLGIRTCPKDYYSMNKSYDVNRLFDISSKGRKGICVDDNDGMGWFYRQATKNLQTGQAQPKVIERISLNVYPDENLIKALDDFIIHSNVNVEYKVPQVFNDWLTRHDPITMYFRENIPKSVKDEVIRIVTPYIRKSPKGEVMLGTKLAEGVYQIPNPTEQDVLNLIKRAKKLGDDKLIECLESTNHVVNGGAGLYSYSHGKPVVKASAGQFKAAEMLIEDLERFKNGSV